MADVSIIVAAYNVEASINRAVRSALGQQGVTVEVIVVNDASTDATLATLQAIVDPRLHIINLQENGGPSAARNAGFAVATSPWIAVLDGDDALEPYRITRCLARAQELKADIVVDNLLVLREEDGASFPMFTPNDFQHRSLLNLPSFIAGNTSFLGGTALGYLKPIFSATFLQKHNLAYDPNIRIGEDYMLLAEALACGAVCAVEAGAGYLYTVRAGSISHRLTKSDIARIRESDQRLLARYNLPPSAIRAQRRRENSLNTAAGFVGLIDALKAQDAKGVVKTILTHPDALFQLWRPALARLQRLMSFRR